MVNHVRHFNRLTYLGPARRKMSIDIKGEDHDTMGEACDRLKISRSTMLRLLKDEFFSEPPTIPQGRGKKVRYFPANWYAENEPRLEKSREEAK